MDLVYVLLALSGGVIPALFWLWFWLREDKKNPEPYRLIALAFIGGMAVVPLALPLQKMALDLYSGILLTTVWVTIEESLKYAAALALVLWNKAVDEPIDYVIYLIAIALGFSALENALFIFNPLVAGDIADSLITGNFRFLGATLLHVLASGTVGVFLAFAFYKRSSVKLMFGTIGLCIAIVLHGLFNFFIMDARGETILTVFLFVWVGIIALFLIFEKLKHITLRHSAKRKRL
ncbi:MAG: PrsW family glutamic-type intramembrane protease [Candidatus Paceibacterota bacterium]